MTLDNKLALFHLLTDLQEANLDYICALTAVIEHIDERISAIDTLLRSETE
jgi:hypothetical protein